MKKKCGMLDTMHSTYKDLWKKGGGAKLLLCNLHLDLFYKEIHPTTCLIIVQFYITEH